MLEIVLMLMAAYCALNYDYAGIMCACLSLDTLMVHGKQLEDRGPPVGSCPGEIA